MATLVSCATGNMSSSSTWKVVSSVSGAHVDSDSASFNISSAISESSSFIPAALAIDAILFKISSTTNPSGTITVTLRNQTTATNSATLTINASALHAKAKGWIVCKFSSSHTPNGADSYTIRINRSIADSVSDRISLYGSSASASNMSRGIRSISTQAPASNDKLIVAGEFTGSSSTNSFVVTMDKTTAGSVVYGRAKSNGDPQGLSINDKGKLTFAVSSATNYLLEVQSGITVFAGGILEIGTSGSPMPSNSTGVIKLYTSTTVDCGLEVTKGGEFTAYGDDKLSWTNLTSNASATDTIISVTSTSGWLAGDVLCFSPTSRTYTESEAKTILTVDSPTQVTLTSGLTYSHSGTSPTRAEVGNLTRNVQVRATDTSSQFGYVYFHEYSSVSLSYVEFYRLGSATASKKGITVGTTYGTSNDGGTVDLYRCTMHEFTATGATGLYGASDMGNLDAEGCVFYDLYGPAVDAQGISDDRPSRSLIANLVIKTSNGHGFSIGNFQTIQDNAIAGVYGNGFECSAVNIESSGWSVHSNNGTGVHIGTDTIYEHIMTNSAIYRNNGGLSVTCAVQNGVFDTISLFGNNTYNISLSGLYCSRFSGITCGGDSSFGTATGLVIKRSPGLFMQQLFFEDSTFGNSSGIIVSHSSEDVNWESSQYATILFNNCLFGSTNKIVGQTGMTKNSYLASQKHNQSSGNHVTYKKYGTLSTDTSIYDSSSVSLRITPNNASNKVNSIGTRGGLFVHTDESKTLTVKIKVRSSVIGDGAAYNGAYPRLRCKKNVDAGVASDVTVATATASSVGAFELISGTVPAVTSSSTLEFYVDCDGTTGWVNVDDFSIS